VKYTLEIPVLFLSTIPSASTLLTVAFLYSFPLIVLKSSANAIDASSCREHSEYSFPVPHGGGFFLFCSPQSNSKVIEGGAMTRTTFTIAVVLLCTSAVGEQPTVIFVSPCECQGFHGKNRWVTKTDLSPVPSDKSAIQSVTPSQIYAWEGLGPDVELTNTTERLPSEQKWYALTGRIVDATPADHSNRRTKPEGYAVWEIHPVMALHVDQ
jgi:hypothetical protein